MSDTYNIYGYQPIHALAIVFSVLVAVSTTIHVYQNFRYRFWKITFFMFYGGVIFLTGWIMRAIGSYHTSNVNVYIAQYVFIFAGPPIYAAAEYNILGRLMFYLPMHAPVSPRLVKYVFIYLGIVVEALTGNGASKIATALPDNLQQYKEGKTIISVSLVIQAAIELIFLSTVAKLHAQCVKTGTLPRNVRSIILMLYGTSTLILFRCIFRAIESFGSTSPTECDSLCVFTKHEWFLYVFEAVPMVIYTYWLNLMHPGKFLPNQVTHYLDPDGKTVRIGPGWIDPRSKLQQFIDPMDWIGKARGKPNREQFWLEPDRWPSVAEGKRDGFKEIETNTNK